MMSFFNYKKGSKKGYMEREGFFYYEIHMKCARFVTIMLLLNLHENSHTSQFEDSGYKYGMIR